MKISKRVRDEFREYGRQGGKLGGAMTAATMTKEQRTERARKGGKARWAKAKAK